MADTHILILGDGKYWAGGVAEFFSTPYVENAFLDSEEGHRNKITRMMEFTWGYPEHQLWAEAEVISLEAELDAHLKHFLSNR